MFKLYYLNPYNNHASSRFFRTIKGMQEHIKKFNCVLPYCYEDDVEHIYVHGCFYPLDQLFDEVTE